MTISTIGFIGLGVMGEAMCRNLARNLSGDDGLSRHERLRRERKVRRCVDKHSGMCSSSSVSLLLGLAAPYDCEGADNRKQRQQCHP